MARENTALQIAMAGVILLAIMGSLVTLGIPDRLMAGIGIGLGGLLVIGAGGLAIYHDKQN